MPNMKRLSKAMTVSQFEKGYWYATALKSFAKSLGIPRVSILRKDQLEDAIKQVLCTGEVGHSTLPARTLSGIRDSATRLKLTTPIANYTNNRETKDFLEREARRLAPGFKRRSGARYRLNRWRETQLAKGLRITYGDLVKKYVHLCKSTSRFTPIPSGRYINFLSEFMAAEKGATMAGALKAWRKLKMLDSEKTYRAWKKHAASRTR